MAQRLLLILMILYVHLICISSEAEIPFVYNGFGQADLYTDGVAKILPKGLLQLTNEEVREECEEEYGPHRFSNKALYNATKGFNKDRLLGKGGFGEVYKGILPSNGEIALKNVSHDAEEGMKHFVSEIVNMGGNLKHKNMVILGIVEEKVKLLLVSEYMPNGSLINTYSIVKYRPFHGIRDL